MVHNCPTLWIFMYLCRLKCLKEHHKVMKKEKRDNYTFLTHAPVHHVIFTMAIPTIISMLSTSLYNLADTYFVGSINTQSSSCAVAFISSTLSIFLSEYKFSRYLLFSSIMSLYSSL